MGNAPHARRRRLVAIGAALVLILGATAVVVAGDDEFPLPVTHQIRGLPLNGVAGQGSNGVSSFKNVTGLICTTATSNASNVNTDCEGDAPHNETAIAVNPTNPSNMVAGANDYQLRLSSGGYVYETAYTRAHVTFDAGKTWETYGIAYKGYISTGDPAFAFDADGTVYSATLGFLWSQGLGCCTNPDILVAHSTDGGKSWSTPSRVAAGTGSGGSVGLFMDKEEITAWGHGNAMVTWTEYNDGQKGSYISSPIMASVTHDSGDTWSTPKEISGSAAFCVGATGGNACNQDQGSVPTVAADGSIYVSFMNYSPQSGDTSGRDQYLVVKVDPETGQRIAGPWLVGTIYDGFHDYPISIDGRQTYQDSEFRSWSFGNITADPTNAGHLAVVWYDMRNSTLPAPADPYATTTNSDVIVSQSTDGGQTWSAPAALAIVGDQFQGWAAYDAGGLLRIGFFDRSYDPANHEYGYTLATENGAGTLAFTTSQLTTVLSDPTSGDRWFSGRTPNPDFPHPTTFLGDYSGIAAVPGAGVVAVWTDMRNTTSFGGRTGAAEDMYFATAP
jgi:hypothetical protein